MAFIIYLAIVISIASTVQAANNNGAQNEWTIGCPCGLISMWYGSTDFPAGYQLCDGTNGTPNLEGKFIIGSDGPTGHFPPCDGGPTGCHPASMGGSNEITIGVDNLPAHKHGKGTLKADGPGTHDHEISGDAINSAGAEHSHGLSSPTADISREDGHTHGIPALNTDGLTDGEHFHTIEGDTTTADNAAHRHGINFDSQDETMPHTHTIPRHSTSGAPDDGEHEHFIMAYTDNPPAPSISGVTFEAIGADPTAGHQIHTDPNDATNDGAHDHNIPSQTTDSNSGHVHVIDGNTNEDGDHDHHIEGGTYGDNDGRHDHTTSPDTTNDNSGHDHTISGNTNNDGGHIHDVTGDTTSDSGHDHKIEGNTGITGINKPIKYYPTYTALRFICCTTAGPGP